MPRRSAKRCIEANIPLAAYDQAIEASHLFNLLQARGVISVQERASYIGRVRDLAKGSCEAWRGMDAQEWVGGIMTDFLLELRSEEIPARMQDKAREDLARLFMMPNSTRLASRPPKSVTFATPRRLALIAKGLPARNRGGVRRNQRAQGRRAATGDGRFPAQGRPDAGPIGRTRRRVISRSSKNRAARLPMCWPKRSPRSSAPSHGPNRNAGAPRRSRPRAFAGSARCRASSRCWVTMWCRAKLTASSAVRRPRATASTTTAK
jgi:hypothetical protein